MTENFVRVAEIDGQPVAMAVGFPDINEDIRGLNGRLLPLGWLKLLCVLWCTFLKQLELR